MQQPQHASHLARLARREWTLVALGVGVWVALAFGGAWFVHQLMRPQEACGGQVDRRSLLPKDPSAGPRNALQLLAGTGRCP
jgi:hypothetical protein